MKQPRTRIARLIADKTLQSGVSTRFVKAVAAYLLSERRTGEVASIMRDVQADWAESGYVEVIARSAYPLNQVAKQDITKQVKALYPRAKQVAITEVLDPGLIGGVRLELANRQLDLSVQAKLNKFKQLTAERDYSG